MKKLLFLALIPLLIGCNIDINGNTPDPFIPEPPEPEEQKYYAFFMYNYPRSNSTSPGGLEERIDNLLYYKQEIELGKTFDSPTDPERNNYVFEGWFKEKTCDNLWDFENDVSFSSIYLYAKWGSQGGEEYIVPEYHYPEKIITDANYRLTGILNSPIENGVVTLADGSIKLLENSPEDISFALNYERKEDVNVTVATYDETKDEEQIHVEVSSGEQFNVTIKNNSASLIINNSTYEDKAKNYENNGGQIERYQVALAGSSSMENWSTSYEDMMPVETFNHGIGGTTVEQWKDKLFERLVRPYSPKVVVYYVGVNDIINNGKNGKTTAANLTALFDKTHEYLPETQIFYILINKLPGFPQYQEQFDIANDGALEYAKENSYLRCIDAGKGLLKENGKPSAAYFVNDGLHMSKYGYVIWGKAVKDAVIDWLVS